MSYSYQGGSSIPSSPSAPASAAPAGPVRPAKPAKPIRKDALRNRQLLIQSAREVFATRGLQASMDDVAHHAGLGVGTAYRHFANKHDLARAIFDSAVDELVAFAEKATAADDAWDGLLSFVEATLEAQSQNRALREILIGRYDDDRDRHHVRITEPYQTLVARAKAAGSVREDVEASDINLIVVMLCTLTDVSAEQAPHLWRRYLPTMLAGLRPGAAPLPEQALTPEQLRAALTTTPRRSPRIG
jgi:AcrR family transcriptional regulator